MQLKYAIGELGSLSYIADKLSLQSGPARRYLMALPWLTKAEAIDRQLSLVDRAIEVVDKSAAIVSAIQLKLSQIRDLKGTLHNLKIGNTLDDIELFELKHFCLLAADINIMVCGENLGLVTLPDANPVLSIIDPEHKRIPTFYISDCFDTKLAELRQQISIARRANDVTHEEQLRDEALAREDEVRRMIGEQLHTHFDVIHLTMDLVVELDILLAKALFFKKYNFNRPVTSTSGKSRFKALFNPQLKEILEQKGIHFQPVDIAIDEQPCLITGANMGGKTVLLKTVALAQMLTQYGFYIPAEEGVVVPVDQVMLSSGDHQSALQGLSSFGAEMLQINNMIATIRKGKKVMALIDEPARTTNPTEGIAIAKAIADMFAAMSVRSLITTHYNGSGFTCRKLRVKGFRESERLTNISIEKLGDYLDYSLEEDMGDTLPHEALCIAEILGADEELLKRARYHLLDPAKDSNQIEIK